MKPQPLKSGLSARPNRDFGTRKVTRKPAPVAVVHPTLQNNGTPVVLNAAGYWVFDDGTPTKTETLEARSRRIDLEELREMQAAEAKAQEQLFQMERAITRQELEFEDRRGFKDRFVRASDQRRAYKEQQKAEKQDKELKALIKHRSVQKQLNLQVQNVSEVERMAMEVRKEQARLDREAKKEREKQEEEMYWLSRQHHTEERDRQEALSFGRMQAVNKKKTHLEGRGGKQQWVLEPEDVEMADILFQMGTGRI